MPESIRSYLKQEVSLIDFIDTTSLSPGDFLYSIKSEHNGVCTIQEYQIAKVTRSGNIVLKGYSRGFDPNVATKSWSEGARNSGSYNWPFFTTKAQAEKIRTQYTRKIVLPHYTRQVKNYRAQIKEYETSIDTDEKRIDMIKRFLKSEVSNWDEKSKKGPRSRK